MNIILFNSDVENIACSFFNNNSNNSDSICTIIIINKKKLTGNCEVEVQITNCFKLPKTGVVKVGARCMRPAQKHFAAHI